MNLEGFTMSKLTKKDKIHIFEEWTLENKRGTYLSKKYGIRREKVNYLINLIKIHGLSVLDKSYTHYSKEYKEHAIKRVLLGNESINAVALDLGLPGNGMLSNWIRSYKENGYNVVIKKKGRRIHELKAQLVKVKQKVADDSAAVALINHALSNLEQGVNLDKVIFDLKRDLNNYALSHNFKLPQSLTELQLKLDENPNKWRDAGLTGSMSSTKKSISNLTT